MLNRAAVAAVLAGWALSAAHGAPPLTEHLPAEAAVYVGWAGRNLAFDGSMLGQLLAEPSVAQAVGALGESLAAAQPADRRPIVQHALAMLSIAWRHRAALCVLRSPGGAAPRGQTLPEMVLLVDLGREQAAFAEHLEALVRLAGPALTVSQATTAGVTYSTLRPSPQWPVLAYGYMGDLLFVTVGAETPARLITVSAAAAPNLAADAAFADAYAEIAGENEQWVLHADVPALLATLGPMTAHAPDPGAPSPAENLLVALGLDRATRVTASVRVVDRGLYTRLRILTPAPHRGVPMLLSGPPLTTEDLSAAPGDTEAMVIARLSASSAWSELRHVLAARNSHRAARLDRAVDGIEQRLGISLENDVLSALGDPWLVVSASSLGGLGSGTAVILNLKAPDKLTQTLATVQGALGADSAPAGGNSPASLAGEPATRPAPAPGRQLHPTPSLHVLPADDTTLTYLQMPGPWSLAPAWAVHRRRLILAGWPQVVQGVMERDPSDTLTAQGPFQSVYRHITGRPTVLVYVSPSRLLDQAYGWPLTRWTRLANRAAWEGTDLLPHWLPAPSVFRRYLGPGILAVSVDDRGILIEDCGSVPTVPTVLAGLWAARQLQGQETLALRRWSLGQVLKELTDQAGRLPPRQGGTGF